MKFPNFSLETKKLVQGFTTVIGCDEVGRGCLAGPVVAAAVVLDPKPQPWYKDINDSKKLSPVKRFTLEKLLRAHSVAFGIGVVSPAMVDKLNIHNASLLAMKRAIKNIKKSSRKDPHGTTVVLVDGRFIIPGLDANMQQQAVVGGDSKVLSIASASILAKTYRDRLMTQLDKKFPQYGFSKHKGYGTPQHKAVLAKHGVSQVHRKSFIHL